MQIVNKIIFVVTGFIIFTAFNSEERNFKSDLPASIKILKTWNLPAILKEISGISFIDNDRIACIQDEMGSVFIYNLSTSSLEDQVSFAAPGDFEGIAMVNKTAWVLRSDGKLFEISSLILAAFS